MMFSLLLNFFVGNMLPSAWICKIKLTYDLEYFALIDLGPQTFIDLNLN